MVYEPEEDSHFLEGFVRKIARGRVLDMGTGSGIQALAAMKREEVISVLAVDIDRQAIAALEQNKLRKKISFKVSDLFSNIKGTFDTIIFNPPYLPDDENDSDLALDGGKNGYELITRFLYDAKKYLAKDGFILLLFSNRTGKEKVDELIKKEKYSSELLGTKSLPFFEELYVYIISLD